jgi:proliferating cell nuclear antigen
MAPLFELRTSQTQTNDIKTLIDTLNCLITDCNITFYPFYIKNENSLSEEEKPQRVGGVVFSELNKSQSVLIDCKLDADQFDYYKYNHKEEKLTIGINLQNLLKFMKCMNNFDVMTWKIEKDDINKLIMILENSKETKEFKINLMDLDYKEYNIDKVDFPYIIDASSQDIQRNIKDAINASDKSEKVEIKCTNENLIFSGSGESGEYTFILNQEKDGIVIHKNEDVDDEIVQGLFELKYLSTFTRCTSLCERMKVYLKNEYPVIVKYTVSNLGELKLVLSQSKKTNLY